jgi:hypothetical protein
MKTLIKKYYSEPHVDSRKILEYVQKRNHTKISVESFLLPVIATGILLLGFFYFLFLLNIEFLSTAITLYSSFGAVLYIIMNLIAGMLFFILQHANIIILSIALVFVVQV